MKVLILNWCDYLNEFGEVMLWNSNSVCLVFKSFMYFIYRLKFLTTNNCNIYSVGNLWPKNVHIDIQRQQRQQTKEFQEPNNSVFQWR